MATDLSPDVTRDVTHDADNMSRDVTHDADEMPLPGETNKEAAARLSISVRQVQRRRERMRQTSDMSHDVTRDIKSVTSDVTPDTQNDRVTALLVEVAELKTTLKGKDELIEELRDTKRILEDRVNRTEVLLQQAQKALPVADPSHDVTPDTNDKAAANIERSGIPIWALVVVITILVAAGLGGYWLWLTR